MPDKLFLYDYKTGVAVVYSQLLNDLSDTQEIHAYSYTSDLYSTFLHIISAIIHQVNLVLLDSDFSEQELSNLKIDRSFTNQSRKIGNVYLATIGDLINSLSHNREWALTLYTSGTTGIPKQVVHNLGSLARAVRASDRHSEDIWGFAYNPTHIAGLQVFFQALFNGNTIVNLFDAPRDRVISLIKDYSITNISATPTFFRMLLPLSDTYPSVRKLTSGGEKFDLRLSSDLMKAFPNAKLRNVYASTEAGTILESKDDTFCIGDAKLCRIRDGELYIHRSLLGDGTELMTDDDWYATGDLVEIVESEPQRFRFLQRKNEMINVGGYKVNPTEVEQIIETHPQVRQAYVYGKANPILGSVLMADVILASELKEKELRNFLVPLLQPHKIPRVINFVDNIELTRTGKMKRTEG